MFYDETKCFKILEINSTTLSSIEIHYIKLYLSVTAEVVWSQNCAFTSDKSVWDQIPYSRTKTTTNLF